MQNLVFLPDQLGNQLVDDLNLDWVEDRLRLARERLDRLRHARRALNLEQENLQNEVDRLRALLLNNRNRNLNLPTVIKLLLLEAVHRLKRRVIRLKVN